MIMQTSPYPESMFWLLVEIYIEDTEAMGTEEHYSRIEPTNKEQLGKQY
jgi:hypothetical protein